MSNILARVESAISATSSGNLTWDRWTLDCAVALGLAGQRNPLGFAIVRYLSDPPSSSNVWALVLCLAARMEKQGVAKDGINELAFQAFEFWQDSRCRSCGGRGIVGPEHRQCQQCGGTGHRQPPSSPDPVSVGISCLLEAESYLEGQLNARMKGATYRQSSDGASVNLPMKDTKADHGFNHYPVTSARKSDHD